MKDINNKKVLITGGAGFLGGHIAEALLQRSNYVILIDNFNSETTPSIEKEKTIKYFLEKYSSDQLSLYREDIRNQEQISNIIHQDKPQVVIHTAALAMDRASMTKSLDFIDVNIKGTQILINAIESATCVEQIIFISTRSAVGETPKPDSLMSENEHFRPINPYGATKAACESLFHSFSFNNKIPVKICRMQPIYGPRCRHDMFVWRILNSIITGNKIQKYGKGNAIRDWLYIDDAVDAILEIINTQMDFDILNIGTGKSVTTNQLIDICEKVSGRTANIENVSAVAGDAIYAGIADCKKIKKLLGWEAKINLEDGIEKTYEYMLKKFEENK